jgi:hypothetical protein
MKGIVQLSSIIPFKRSNHDTRWQQAAIGETRSHARPREAEIELMARVFIG